MKNVMMMALVVLLGAGWAGANLLQNGDFETANGSNPAGWTLYNNSTGGNGSYETAGGNPGAYIRLWSPGARSGDFQLYWYQTVAVTPSTTYTLSFDYTAAGEYNYARLSYWQGPGANNWAGFLEIADYLAWGFAPSLNASSAWTTKTTTFTTPSNCNYIQVLFLQNTGWGSNLNVDNVNLVPEPATMSLILLGLAGVLRRR